MEHLVKAFTRVVRKIDDGNVVINLFPKPDEPAASNPSSRTDLDRRRILDFPDAETQSSNIAASSSLDKASLLKRAAESPSELTTSEIDLLKERYWLGISRNETKARSLASSALLAVSEDHWRETTKRLKEVRGPLYEENEAKAIENADWEAWRRRSEASRGRQEQEAEAALGNAPPWVRRLWEEDKARKAWGYAMFVEPEVLRLEHMDEYSSRRDAATFFALRAICCGNTIAARWTLRRLDWPVDATGEDDAESASNKRAMRFQKLREQFVLIRDRAPKKQRTSEGATAKSGGLSDGVLQNVFLVADRDSVDSVLSKSGNVDDMWIWAVDPDYDVHATTSSKSDQKDEYEGCLRVRLQQLVNNFFEVRRFHEEYSMKNLWEAAQKSKNQAFVSTRDEESGQWTMSRDVGSVVRPQR